jgi:hypothetical protein
LGLSVTDYRLQSLRGLPALERKLFGGFPQRRNIFTPTFVFVGTGFVGI